MQFAIDSSGILRSDEKAMKIAGHELKSLDCLFSCNVPTLFFPLLALVDYKGYRLIALSKLPVDKSTLESGSCDAGKTLRSGNAELNHLIDRACSMLNLKQHYVTCQGQRQPDDGYGVMGHAKINGPIDLEGHRGFDSRYYLLDFSRLFPPSKMDRAIHCGHLFQLFRPEFVRRNPAPLCSDAFSRFVSGAPDAASHTRELAEAELLMETDILPSFANMLRGQRSELYQLVHLVHSLHRQGINIRRIGLLRSLLSGTSWADMLLVEMIARSNKWVLRELLRNVAKSTALPADVPFKEIVVKHLNVLFGDSSESVDFWRNEITQQIRAKFGTHALSDEDLAHGPGSVDGLHGLFSTTKRPLKCMLFRRLSEMTGLQFSSTALETFSNSAEAFDGPAPFDISHVETLLPTVKHVTLLEHSQAAVIKYKADLLRYKPARIGEYLRLAKLAVDRFERALACNPSNKYSLRSCADLLAATPELPQSEARADAYYQLALEADPNDVQSLIKYAAFLFNVAKKPESAEDYVVRAVELEPNNTAALLLYADLLAYGLGDPDTATEFYDRAVASNPNSALTAVAHLKYAFFLWKHDPSQQPRTRELYSSGSGAAIRPLPQISRGGLTNETDFTSFLQEMVGAQ